MKICWHRGREAWRNVKQDLHGLPSSQCWHGPGAKARLLNFTGGLGSRCSSTDLLIESGPSWEWKLGIYFHTSDLPRTMTERQGEMVKGGLGTNRFITNDSSTLLFMYLGPLCCLSLFLALSIYFFYLNKFKCMYNAQMTHVIIKFWEKQKISLLWKCPCVVSYIITTYPIRLQCLWSPCTSRLWTFAIMHNAFPSKHLPSIGASVFTVGLSKICFFCFGAFQFEAYYEVWDLNIALSPLSEICQCVLTVHSFN